MVSVVALATSTVRITTVLAEPVYWRSNRLIKQTAKIKAILKSSITNAQLKERKNFNCPQLNDLDYSILSPPLWSPTDLHTHTLSHHPRTPLTLYLTEDKDRSIYKTNNGAIQAPFPILPMIATAIYCLPCREQSY